MESSGDVLVATTTTDADEQNFADAITSAVQNKYASLPERGKPARQEWTVLAGIVATTHDVGDESAIGGKAVYTSSVAATTARVVALATGTKCLGPSRMSEHGWVIHDCHAEILCRRALVHIILSWLDNTTGKTKNGSLDWLLERVESVSDNVATSGMRVRLKPGVKLHLYISDSPCGDGALVGVDTRVLTVISHAGAHVLDSSQTAQRGVPGCKDIQTDQSAELQDPVLQQQVTGVGEVGCDDRTILPLPKRARIGRITGAKPASASQVAFDSNNNSESVTPTTNADPTSSVATLGGITQGENKQEQTVGALRTKSGRSDLRAQDRTMCMSCSDKILQWNFVGMQGALLADVMAEPIMLSSVIVGADAMWPDLERSHVRAVVSRAVYGRALSAFPNISINVPRVLVSSVGFERSRQRVSQGKTKATGQSICWSVGDGKKAGEVLGSARGAKQGTTAKNWNNGKTSSRLCKRNMGELTCRVLFNKTPNASNVPYCELKTWLGPKYQERKHALRQANGFMNDWVVAPERFSAFVVGLDR